MTNTTKIAYHLGELEDAQTPSCHAHNIPVVLPDDQSILDVGCGLGQTLVALNLDSTHNLVGIDIDPEPLEYGSKHFNSIQYAQARAEQLPFANASFDLVLSRVALPYTNIPVVLNEMQRVLEPGGRVWLTLHTQRFTLSQLRDSIKRGNIKDVLFRCYVVVNSYGFSQFGKMFNFPLNRKRCESFQTDKSMRKALLKHGFTNIDIKRGRHFEVTANKVLKKKVPANKVDIQVHSDVQQSYALNQTTVVDYNYSHTSTSKSTEKPAPEEA